jgi:integrating conjugative element relaxase (TIGR03760 family)
MLNRLKTSLFGRRELPAASLAPHTEKLPAGFQPVLTAETLAAGEGRQRSLRIIHQTMSMPAALYDTLCYQPLCALLLRVQQVPATELGIWSRQGGFGDLTLQYTACAVRLAKGYMFPPGAAPEEQSAQSSAWNAVVFWAALFRHLPLLARLEGELSNGEHWQPGMTVPEAAYRCRFRQSAPSGAGVFAQASLIAAQLLPEEAVNWLSGTPTALHNLTGALWNGHPEMMLIRDILRQATEKTDAPSVATGISSSTVAAQPAMTLTPAVYSTGSDTTASPDTVTGTTDILLSELASSMLPGSDAVAPAVDEPVMVSPSSIPDVADSVALPAPDASAPSDETDMLLSLFSMVPNVDASGTIIGDEVAISAAPGIDVDGDEPIAVTIKPDLASAADSVTEGMSAPEQPALLPPNEICMNPIGVAPAGANKAEKQAQRQETDIKDAPEITTAGDALPGGDAFLQWLKEGLRSGQLPVNGLDDKVHIVAGHVFLPVPGIFFEYMKQTGKEVGERERIQREFEQLNICKRHGNKRYWFAHQRRDEQGQGGYNKRKGYLVKARLLFGKVPQDSPYLSFP